RKNLVARMERRTHRHKTFSKPSSNPCRHSPPVTSLEALDTGSARVASLRLSEAGGGKHRPLTSLFLFIFLALERGTIWD
ncbi:hypothetical protein, partial [Microbulbifer halophilus]|uniref:hypothetical protein n=1 Tax=Microbulbifer halophilus TaxID=453963 RepID=UPI00362A3E37